MAHKTLQTIKNWFDSYAEAGGVENSEKPNWLRVIPLLILHFACASVIWVGWSPVALIVAIVFYAIRMVGITAFYHRYFAHKSFKTGRVTQFVFALIGSAATQRGPLWWASHHRHHHYHSDTELDVHSPRKGAFWSHIGWFLSDKHFKTRLELIPDFARFKELVLLDRFDMIVPIVCIAFMYLLGSLLNYSYPQLGTSGLQMLVWGYAISTVVLLHATLCINSLAHRMGSRRFKTDENDTSRNNLVLALITFGEGWHNNHHRFPNSARQGLRWWELDLSFSVIKIMEKIGLVWSVNAGPTAQQVAQALRENEESSLLVR